MKTIRMVLAGMVCGAGLAVRLPAAEDYQAYARESKDFKRVAFDRKVLLPAEGWSRWTFMIWRAGPIGRAYNDALVADLSKAGFDGFCDHQPGKDAVLHEKYGMLWYLDHTAGKGFFKPGDHTPGGIMGPERTPCLLSTNRQTEARNKMQAAITKAREYKNRAAYALDDEVSWSSFTSPCKWDNDPRVLADFSRWLKERYGSEEALKRQWTEGAPEGIAKLVDWGHWPALEPAPAVYVTRHSNPDDYLALFQQPMDQWNLSAWCDSLSYQDSMFNNLIGDFVDYANTLDPERPCGYVGGGGASPYGGYDYAKLTRKIQYLEAYDVNGAMEIGRSLFPGNLVPTVRTLFSSPLSTSDNWFKWHYLAHGDRGIICWAEKWLTPQYPLEKIKEYGVQVSLVRAKAPKIFGATWVHDGVALYYSQPSIQVAWFVDVETHGDTWGNRKSSLNNSLNSSGAIAWSWQEYLEDQKIQYNWYSYADLLQRGIDPQEYKVLILPRTLCLSQAEAAEIRRYVQAGGVVIADHQTGIFDQHGKACPRGKGALDDLFGIENRPVCRKGSLFYGEILGEKNDDKYYELGNFVAAGLKTWGSCKREKGLVVAQRDLPCFARKATGKGWACHMNVSLMEYPAIRGKGAAAATAYSAPVTALLREAGIQPWVKLELAAQKADDGAASWKEPELTEATYWRKDGRIVMFVVKNPLIFAHDSSAPEGMDAITGDTRDLRIVFSGKKEQVIDEMSGRELGSGDTFVVPWKMDQAAMISFADRK